MQTSLSNPYVGPYRIEVWLPPNSSENLFISVFILPWVSQEIEDGKLFLNIPSGTVSQEKSKELNFTANGNKFKIPTLYVKRIFAYGTDEMLWKNPVFPE